LQIKEKGEIKMKKRLSIFAVLMMTFLVVPTFAFVGPYIGRTPGVPHDADAMWVEDATNTFNTGTTSAGYKFNVTVNLNITENIYGWQVKMHFNPTQLKADFAGLTATGTSMYFLGHTTTTAPVSIDNGLGTILAFESCQGSDFIPGKAASLFGIQFEILQTPDKVNKDLTSLFDISSEYGYDGNTTANTWVANEDASTFLQFTPSNGNYEFTWVAPTTQPRMDIEGPTAWPIQYGPSPPTAIGQAFTAKLYIKNLDAAWGLTNASFTLSWNNTVIDVLGGAANITIDAAWTGANTKTMGSGSVDIYVENHSPQPSGTVHVADIVFTVLIQGNNPPQSTPDSTDLLFSNVVFFDHIQEIAHDPSGSGHVDILSLIALPLPYLKVVPSAILLGPAPVIGSTFDVDVVVVNMSQFWYNVAVQFRLQYDGNVLGFVTATEGGYITDPQWDLYGSFFFATSYLAAPIFGDHVAGIALLYPNITTGEYDQPVLPNTIESPAADPTVATVTFEVLAQNCFDMPPIVTYLNLSAFWLPTDQIFIDWNATYIPSTDNLNATVTILALNQVDRQIDLVGGAVNDGYGILPGTWPFPYPAPSYYMGTPSYLAFPTPYGGQGPDHWMDIVFPQSQIYLDVYVTYNYWPVQSKDVGFEIEGPYTKLPNGTLVPAQTYQIWAKLTATTDANGVATLTYRMPWPCNDPDSITGVWKITSTVTVADQVVSDTMIFYYQRLVYITSVTTDSYSYIHDQCVKVTVDYETHAVQEYPALFAIVIEDNLTVPFGFATYSTEVGGATFCTWLTGEFTVEICIPKWAYAGNGLVLVSVYDKDPTEGGEAIAPSYTPIPIINIYPY
jgi:hypothetical protein